MNHPSYKILIPVMIHILFSRHVWFMAVHINQECVQLLFSLVVYLLRRIVDNHPNKLND